MSQPADLSSLHVPPNSETAIAARVATGRVRADAVIVVALARTVLSFLAQGLTALVLWAQGHAEPFVGAQAWFTVHGTLVDVGSLALLVWYLRREGLGLTDLFRARVGPSLGRSLLQVPLILLVVGAVGFSAGALTGLVTMGTAFPPPPVSPLPLWAGLYSTLVWPLIWGFTEQMTYDGYCAPRAAALGRGRWLLAIVAFGWAAQHLALPFQWDAAFLACRFFPSLAVALTCMAIYLRTRNLLPLALAHWIIDAGTGALTLAGPTG